MPTSTLWQRSWNDDQNWQRGWRLIGSLVHGQTLLRIRLGFGYTGVTRVEESFLRMSLQSWTFGVCTVIGNQLETPPSPRADPEDIDPPGQRWLWWESRNTQLVQIEPTSTIAYWKSSEPQEPVDIKSMVSTKALTFGEGEFLDVWASWEAFENWPESGWANVWIWSSVLIQLPS